MGVGQYELFLVSFSYMEKHPTKRDASTQSETSSLSKSTQTSSENRSVSTSTQTADLPVQSVVVPCYFPAGRITPIAVIKCDDESTKFYTGLPSWSSFEFILNFICEEKSQSKLSKLTPADGLLLTLMRLQLNLTMIDLSYRFHVSTSTAGTVFATWIEDLFVNFKCFIKWPSQEIARKNLPSIFADLYPRTQCIIDCSEVFIAQTYSNYKKHNTIKFLIGVTACGAIRFLSKCWGGRPSDRCINMNSEFLNLFSNGDTILADSGFTISEDLAVYGANLEIPSFTHGKKQLSLEEVECSKRLSKVRIHVEHVIGLLKNKYTILKEKIPVTLLKRKGDLDFAFIDKIITVLCIDKFISKHCSMLNLSFIS